MGFDRAFTYTTSSLLLPTSDTFWSTSVLYLSSEDVSNEFFGDVSLYNANGEPLAEVYGLKIRCVCVCTYVRLVINKRHRILESNETDISESIFSNVWEKVDMTAQETGWLTPSLSNAPY